MAPEPAPAIRTAYDERYSHVERIKTIGSDTTFHRGFGETGTRVELVDTSAIGGCPRCGTDEMVLSLGLNPDAHDDAAFYCTNISCPHFVQDAVEYYMTLIRADQPETWDNTAICPSCNTRHTVEIDRYDRLHNVMLEEDTKMPEVRCDDCKAKHSSSAETNADT